MKREDLFAAIGMIDERYIAGKKKKASGRLRRFAAMAACLCLLSVGGIYSAVRLGYFAAGCGAYCGTIVDDAYYFYIPHSGVYVYDGGTAEKCLGAWWVDDWSVNEYGVYYSCGRSFGVVPHETGKRQVLYRGGIFETSHVRHTLMGDGSVVLTLYNKHTKIQSEVLLDGKTGEVLSAVMEPTAYSGAKERWSERNFAVGQRRVEMVETGQDRYDLQENGRSILPEGVLVRRYSAQYIGGNLIFTVRYADQGGPGELFILRPDGNDTLVQTPEGHFYHSGTQRYLFDAFAAEDEYEVWCLDIVSGESWQLSVGEGSEIYSLETDGEVLYATAPWAEYQALWRVLCDEGGRPAALALLDEDILS